MASLSAFKSSGASCSICFCQCLATLCAEVRLERSSPACFGASPLPSCSAPSLSSVVFFPSFSTSASSFSPCSSSFSSCLSGGDCASSLPTGFCSFTSSFSLLSFCSSTGFVSSCSFSSFPSAFSSFTSATSFSPSLSSSILGWLEVSISAAASDSPSTAPVVLSGSAGWSSSRGAFSSSEDAFAVARCSLCSASYACNLSMSSCFRPDTLSPLSLRSSLSLSTVMASIV
mmetsp:Transcript_71496/g.170977  ORF Transcript_71496/g.170977 Transcript_71496/m.170977 type:complete len:230 (+) Transcript_71496:1290-1979(+)